MPYARLSTDADWSAARVAGLPPRWQRRVITRWLDDRRGDTSDTAPARTAANLALLTITDQLAAVRLPLAAQDAQVCERAALLASECMSLASVWHEPKQLRMAMERVVLANHCQPPAGEAINPRTGEIRGVRDAGAIARMSEPLWWRRALRRMHAKAVESAAIELGYVNVRRDVYVSNESLERRGQQRKRNADMLEDTIARNEDGDEFTLAALAARSVANKAIRRAELMTRISGFERIARDLGHVGLFFTVTCPSRMHKWRKHKAGGVSLNPRYDGTTPRDAQAYLSRMWSRIRAKLDRQGVDWYGFRIAEPNHDGTPHWHVLVFFRSQWPGQTPRAALPRVCATVRRYALKDSPGEFGAKQHRADFEPIDWNKGTAAGYIAKYVSKNIDGYAVGDDLYGNPALESSARVEAWAATWGIRQFQQVGGPPVGVWRELRRVDALPDDAPDALVRAHLAVNKTAAVEGDGKASVSWANYIKAQGGIGVPRDALQIQLFKEHDERTGRYGDAMPAVVRGVRANGVETYRDGIVMRERSIQCVVRSVRHAWEIVSRRAREGSKAAIGRAWTRVNNCTRGADGKAPAFPHGERHDEWISDYEKASGWMPT